MATGTWERRPVLARVDAGGRAAGRRAAARPGGRDRRSAAATPAWSRPIELARAGATVTLLERDGLGHGASSRNGGLLHPGLQFGRAALVARFGPELGGALHQAGIDARATTERYITDNALAADHQRVGLAVLAWSRRHLSALEQELEEYRAGGLTGRMLRTTAEVHEELGSDHYPGGYVLEESEPHPPRAVPRRAGRARNGRGRGHPHRHGRTAHRPGWRRPTRDHQPRPHPVTRGARRDQRLHRRRRPLAAAAGPAHRLVHHRHRAALAGAGRRHQPARPDLLRQQGVPLLLAHQRGAAADLRRARLVLEHGCRPDGSHPGAGDARGPPPDPRPAHRLRVGRPDRLHLRPAAAPRASTTASTMPWATAARASRWARASASRWRASWVLPRTPPATRHRSSAHRSPARPSFRRRIVDGPGSCRSSASGTA